MILASKKIIKFFELIKIYMKGTKRLDQNETL